MICSDHFIYENEDETLEEQENNAFDYFLQ
jgi:hypothetical protein